MRFKCWGFLLVPLVMFPSAISMAQQEGKDSPSVKVDVLLQTKSAINQAVYRLINHNPTVSNTHVSITIGDDDTLTFGAPDSNRSIRLPTGSVRYSVSGQATVEFVYGAPAYGNVHRISLTLTFSGEGKLNLPKERAGRSVMVTFTPDVDMDALSDLPSIPFEPGGSVEVTRDWPLAADCLLKYDDGRVGRCAM